MNEFQKRNIKIAIITFFAIGLLFKVITPNMESAGLLFLAILFAGAVWFILTYSKVNISNGISSDNDEVAQVSKLILSDEPFSNIRRIAGGNEVDLKLLQKSFDHAIGKALEDNLLTIQEENRIEAFIEYFQLTQDDLNRNKGFENFIKSRVLRDITSGEIPEKSVSVTDWTLNKIYGK